LIAGTTGAAPLRFSNSPANTTPFLEGFLRNAQEQEPKVEAFPLHWTGIDKASPVGMGTRTVAISTECFLSNLSSVASSPDLHGVGSLGIFGVLGLLVRRWSPSGTRLATPEPRSHDNITTSVRFMQQW